MKWAIEECLKTSLPVAATMCIGPEGNMHGVSATECGIRMAKAGVVLSPIFERDWRCTPSPG